MTSLPTTTDHVIMFQGRYAAGRNTDIDISDYRGAASYGPKDKDVEIVQVWFHGSLEQGGHGMSTDWISGVCYATPLQLYQPANMALCVTVVITQLSNIAEEIPRSNEACCSDRHPLACLPVYSPQARPPNQVGIRSHTPVSNHPAGAQFGASGA